MAPHCCVGCGKGFEHKTGFSNHQRNCDKWKNFDGVCKLKRRRLNNQAVGPSDAPGPVQPRVIEEDDAPEDIPPPVEAPPPPPQTSTRSGRSVRFPGRYRDFLPVTRTALAHVPSKEKQPAPREVIISRPGSPAVSSLAGSDEEVPPDDPGLLATITTTADCFGLYRVYARKPLQSNNANTRNDTTSSDSRPGRAPNQGSLAVESEDKPYYFPFSSPSAAAMMVTHHLGTSVQSVEKTTQIASILGSLGSDLDPLDLLNFSATVENRKLDDHLANAAESTFHREDGWLNTSVRIRLPLDKTKMLESEAAELEVKGLFYRDIVDVISSVYQGDTVHSFNNIPFKHYWKSSEDAIPERLYGEIFSSQAMLDADDEISNWCLGNTSLDSDLEAVTVPLLLYSDSTHLANFGTASCWPVYLFFGAQSKYIRAMPTASACHHIAYMPKVCLT
jgi:hypothetical protein